MSDEYQLRKDIDRLIQDVYDLESGAVQLASLTDLKTLEDYVKNNESLSSLSVSLENFGEDLDKYNGELEEFSDDLEEYGSELGGFSTQLSGFTTTLNSLRTWIFGYDPANPDAHSYSDPTSDSLKGMVDGLQDLVIQLQTGDGIVLENLGRLKDHIQAFSGTLQEFKTYLIEQGVNVSTLDDSVISLILELNKSLDVISDHSSMLEEAQEYIGEPATPTTEATGFFKRLDDGDAIMEDLDSRASQLEVTIDGDPTIPTDTGLVGATNELIETVTGNDGLIDKTDNLIDTIGEKGTGGTASTGMYLLIDNAQATANAVDGVTTLIKTKMGYDSIVGDDLQTQLTSQGDDISGIKVDMGTVPTGKTLQGQITAHDGEIGTVQDQIGDVDTDWQGDLQSQINDVIYAVLDMLPVIHIVETLSDVSSMQMGRRGYYAPYGFPYNYIYVKDTGKYYELITQDNGE